MRKMIILLCHCLGKNPYGGFDTGNLETNDYYESTSSD